MPQRSALLLTLVALALDVPTLPARAQTTTPLVGYRPPADSVRHAMVISDNYFSRAATTISPGL